LRVLVLEHAARRDSLFLQACETPPPLACATLTLARHEKSPRRPFYAEYAWAFDLLIDRPVRKECAVVGSWLVERGVVPGSTLLDAGCGTGRYAAELARRGYVVHGVDLSPELVAVATQLTGEHGMLSFAVGDILALPTASYDAILCRGVLNDLLDDDERAGAFAAFARALRRAGVLILDVREWEASAERKSREPVFKKTVPTDRGTLTFTSVTDVDIENRRLLLSERHTLRNGDREQVSDYQFEMRCWTRDELDRGFSRSGLDRVRYFGAYDPLVEAGRTDRVVAVAQRSQGDERSFGAP
jgi:SAM-dependent methyltransferase